MTKKDEPTGNIRRFPPARKSFAFKQEIGKNKGESQKSAKTREFIEDHITEQKVTEALLDQYCARARIKPDLRLKFKAAVHALAAEANSGRVELLDMIATQQAGTATWAKRIEGERASRQPLPEIAPALWAEEKQPGDTPPSFIKRHYGEHLHSDATGLTRPDIKRLDPQLYTALANWLRKNELPEDCPLPTKTEQSASLIDKIDQLSNPGDLRRAAAALMARTYNKR